MHADNKDLTMRAISDKAFKDRGWKISQTCKYDRYQRGFAGAMYRFFDKKTESGVNVNEVQAQELHKFKRKVFKVQR